MKKKKTEKRSQEKNGARLHRKYLEKRDEWEGQKKGGVYLRKGK